ncbi:MAG: hypothetical protein PHC64_06380 [Candidatus Gastranaerophilales bacterium]|nr:hypothetical protein [Candidatus Gastranaerophilales bacterium]
MRIANISNTIYRPRINQQRVNSPQAQQKQSNPSFGKFFIPDVQTRTLFKTIVNKMIKSNDQKSLLEQILSASNNAKTNAVYDVVLVQHSPQKIQIIVSERVTQGDNNISLGKISTDNPTEILRRLLKAFNIADRLKAEEITMDDKLSILRVMVEAFDMSERLASEGIDINDLDAVLKFLNEELLFRSLLS